jgi:hypothetical protein
VTNGSASCLVHFHIPRTRGTWLRQSLIRHLSAFYRPDQIFFVGGPSECGCAHGGYETLWQLPKRRLSQLRLVTGHMPASIFDLMPNAFFITILRDPLERCLSDYWFCYHDTTNPAHRFARALSPIEFCRRGYGQARNGHARYLSGAVYRADPWSDREILRRAMRALERIDLFGFDGDLELFFRTLDVSAGIHELEMSGSLNSAERLWAISDDERALIVRENWIDYRLYEAALRRALPLKASLSGAA